LVSRKSAEYSASADIFTNLKACEAFGIISAELGVWVRLADKTARLGSLLKNGAEPEATLDTILDMINYAAYVYLLLIERDRSYAHLIEEKEREAKS
jgi:hypothetical protein